MPVTLAYALQDGKTIHISDKFQKDMPLFCPHCKDGVIAKKGAKMQHHFAHKPYTRCSVSAETILHFESKLYLKELIVNKTPVAFQTKIALLDEKVKRWFVLLGNTNAEISLLRILQTYGIKNATEETGILGYVPDVLGIGDQSFAFEIYVTHALEEQKIQAFKRAGVDYIELIPEREEDGSFSYTVHDAHLPQYTKDWAKEIEKTFEATIRPSLYQEWKENEAQLVKRMEKETRPSVVEEVCETLTQNVARFYLTRDEAFSKKQRVMHAIRRTPRDEEGETWRLHEAYVRLGKNNLPYLVLKDEYKRRFTMDGTHALFAKFLQELNAHYEIHLSVNEKGNVDGITFVNTLDKIGFDQDVQKLLKHNLEVLRENANKK